MWWKIDGVNRIVDRPFPENATWNRVVEYIWNTRREPKPATDDIHVRHRFSRSLFDLSFLLTSLAFANCLSLSPLSFLPAA